MNTSQKKVNYVAEQSELNFFFLIFFHQQPKEIFYFGKFSVGDGSEDHFIVDQL